MKKIVLIGDPVSHSLSPKMQNAAFKELNLPFVYEALRIPKDNFQSEIKKILFGSNIVGANVTAPYKEEILSYVSSNEASTKIKAVNTIKFSNNIFHGYNTDVYGIKMLLKELGLKNNFMALILGNGGAARAAEVAIRELSGKSNIARRGDNIWNNIEESSAEYNIVINATGGDQFKFDWKRIPEEVTAIDLRYMPDTTIFLKNAAESGHKFYNGLKILLHQGALSFEIWTDLKPPIDSMSRAIGLPN